MDIRFQLLLVCPLIFLAGFVDSIAGGGGIIGLLAYYLAGIPPHSALACNKFGSFCGVTLSTGRFIINKKVSFLAAGAAVPAALLGSYLGARVALFANEMVLRYCLLIMLPIAGVFVLKNKNFRENGAEKALSTRKTLLLSALAGFIIGGYDGFFGPGAGTFLMIVFNVVIGLDILRASGTAKIVNWSSNLASLIAFLPEGQVLFALAVPAAVCNILGSFLGSGLALKNGMRIIRPIMVSVMALLAVRVLFDVFTAI